jgi:ankyrin repeat protein
MGNTLYSRIKESIEKANYEQFDDILKKLPPNYNINNISEYSILHNIIKKYYTNPEKRVIYAKMFMDSLKKGANINSFDKDGNTLLINSIIEDEYNIARFLIKNGANPNIPNKKNYKSPLVYASQSGKDNFVILLLKQNGIIIQPNAISTAENKEIQNLIRSKIKQLDYEYKIKKLKNDINFKESSYIIPLLDELRENN